MSKSITKCITKSNICLLGIQFWESFNSNLQNYKVLLETLLSLKLEDWLYTYFSSLLQYPLNLIKQTFFYTCYWLFCHFQSYWCWAQTRTKTQTNAWFLKMAAKYAPFPLKHWTSGNTTKNCMFKWKIMTHSDDLRELFGNVH